MATVEHAHDSSPEATFNNSPTSRENFKAQAEDIVAELGRAARESIPRQQAYERAYEAYVYQEENPELQTFSKLLLGARGAEKTTKHLDSLNPKIENKTASLEERRHYYKLLDTAIKYNHELRDVIWQNPLLITKSDMKTWLEQAGSGDSQWTDRILNGMSAEIAVAREIQKVPGVREVRMSSIEEDSKGVDVVAILKDRTVWGVDVKSGQQSIGYMPRTNGMEIGVDNEMLSGFATKKKLETPLRVLSD